MSQMSVRGLGRATLARQLLLERADLGVVEAVERLAGMQAQEPKHPYVGLWTRLTSFEDTDLTSAVEDHSVVRATMMRGTLHLVSAADYASYRLTLAPVLEAGLSALGDRGAGLDPPKVVKAAERLLAKEPLTFTEVRAALQEKFPDVNERALGFTTRMMVPLVVVPSETRWGYAANPRFSPGGDWVSAKLTDNGAAELARRYLAAFGPATPADFQTWSGLQKAKPLFDSLDLVELSCDGKAVYDLPDAPRPGEDAEAPARYLPEFDNLLLAHAIRTRVIADEHKPAVYTRNLRVKSTYLVDGMVAGQWTADKKRGVATLHLTPFGRLLKKHRTALEEEGDALLRFLEPDAKSHAFEVS
jgi:DNA glycosylase AlkZ-like